LRALLLQAVYSVRSERLLMEQLDYNLLFRWFVGLNMDDNIWDVTVFTKNRERLLDGDIAEAFFQAVLQQARERSLLSDEHFTVDGTLLEAVQRNARIDDGPGCQDGTQGQGQGSQTELQRESAGGEPPRADREHRGVRGQRNGGARCPASDAGADSGHETGNGGRRQGLRHGGFRSRVPKLEGHAACGTEPGATRWECD
jgi:IS5 family transposase